MDQIFDRLGNLLKSVLNDGKDDFSQSEDFSDPDMEEAWAELNDFMNSDDSSQAKPSSTRNSSAPQLPKEIRDAFDEIGVAPSATNEEVGKAYKTLLLKHHPDRFATEPAKLAAATERTKSINSAFQQIKSYRTNTSGGA